MNPVKPASFPRKFLIADLHLGHKKVIAFENAARPFATIEEHDEAMVERWNSVVSKRDVVWVLGDVLFGQHSFATLGKMRGMKRLVMGNHDQYPIAKYAEHFSSIYGCVRESGVILSHVPVHPDQLKKRFAANVHGHLHSNTVDDPRYYCVSAEQNNLTPILFDKVMDNLRHRGVLQAHETR